MPDLETLERGKKMYEALIHASHPHATCEWSQISTVAHGAADFFHLTVTVNDRTIAFPSISFTDMEKFATGGDPILEQTVRQTMGLFD